jgi:hypothetical protein
MSADWAWITFLKWYVISRLNFQKYLIIVRRQVYYFIKIVNEPYYCIVWHGTSVCAVERPWAYIWVVLCGQKFIIYYDGPWVQWLFCCRHIMHEWGHDYGFTCSVSHPRSDSVGLLVCMRTYSGHQCYITGFSGQRQPCWKRVKILGRPYRTNYILYVYKIYFSMIFSWIKGIVIGIMPL